MILDANSNPVLSDIRCFKKVTLVDSRTGSPVHANIILKFRSFWEHEPFQALEEISAEIIKGEKTFSSGATRYSLREKIRDTTTQCTIHPFDADLLEGFPLSGMKIRLHPLPFLKVEVPRHENQENSLRIWGDGFSFNDLMFSSRHLKTTQDGLSATGVSSNLVHAHIYPITICKAGGRFYVFPGKDIRISTTMSDLIAESTGEAPPSPIWARHPDHCLILPEANSDIIDSLARKRVALYGLLRATTGMTPGPVSILRPISSDKEEGTFNLFSVDKGEGADNAMESIPFKSHAVSINTLFSDCWPRVEYLLDLGFNFTAISGWFHRGKNTRPTEQGFLNLFVFLECLKAHWLSLKKGTPMDKPYTNFEGNVNKTLKDILGQRKKIGEFVEFRNRMVHQGVSGLPSSELLDRYFELYRLCAATYLSLIGWTGQWGSICRKNGLLQTVVENPWWNPPNLSKIFPDQHNQT